jgi:hypothetical protein
VRALSEKLAEMQQPLTMERTTVNEALRHGREKAG